MEKGELIKENKELKQKLADMSNGTIDIGGVMLQRSTGKKLDKMNDFIILKNMIFQIQSFNRKKVILRIKAHIKEDIPSGIYNVIKPRS